MRRICSCELTADEEEDGSLHLLGGGKVVTLKGCHRTFLKRLIIYTYSSAFSSGETILLPHFASFTLHLGRKKEKSFWNRSFQRYE